MSAVERYPLSWPTGWKRTSPYQRQNTRFSKSEWHTGQHSSWKQKRALTVADAVRRLVDELERLGVLDFILSSNLQVRLDGLPRSGQSKPTDPGVAVYFKLKGKDRVFACDKWTTVEGNIAAVAAHIAAIRAVERYGVGTLDQAFAGYTALPPAASNWRLVLEFAADARLTADDVISRYRLLAQRRHPDKGGSDAAMAELNAARDAALAELSK